jgi:rRNA-processing protein FCF1
MAKLKIILDTNFLVYCAENKIHYKEEIDRLVKEGHELAVPMQVILELKEICEKAYKVSDRDAAKLALKLIQANEVNVITGKGNYADDAIIYLVKEDKAIVATIDKLLRKKIGRFNRVIVIEGKRKLSWG